MGICASAPDGDVHRGTKVDVQTKAPEIKQNAQTESAKEKQDTLAIASQEKLSAVQNASFTRDNKKNIQIKK